MLLPSFGIMSLMHVNIYVKTSQCIQSIKILVKTEVKDIIFCAQTFLENNVMSRISHSILSSRKQINKPGKKLLLHLLNGPKMTSLNKTQSKIILERVDKKQAQKPEYSPPNLEEAIPHFYRVYHKLQISLGHIIHPYEWSWKMLIILLFQYSP